MRQAGITCNPPHRTHHQLHLLLRVQVSKLAARSTVTAPAAPAAITICPGTLTFDHMSELNSQAGNSAPACFVTGQFGNGARQSKTWHRSSSPQMTKGIYLR